MIRQTLLMASRSEGLKNLAANTPVTRSVVERYVAGETTGDAVRVAAELADGGMLSTIDHLGEDTVSIEQADGIRDAYLDLLRGLDEAGLAGVAEVSVKLSAIGQALPDGPRIATENAHVIASAAAAVGTTVTLDM